VWEKEDWDCVEVKDTGPGGGADGKDWFGPAVY
jgi:hypothetical protein